MVLISSGKKENEKIRKEKWDTRKMVEGKGFEPSVSLRPTHAFQACSLNHSDTPLKSICKANEYFRFFEQKNTWDGFIKKYFQTTTIILCQ